MVQDNCPTCQGAGLTTTPSGSAYQQCPSCNGSGKDPGQEIPFQYVFDIASSVFTAAGTAGATQTSIGVTTLGEADFIWKAFTGFPNTLWRARFGFGGGGYMSSGGQGSTNDRVRAENFCGTAQFPFPIWPHVVVPRTGKILFDLENLSNAGQTLQLCFIGALVYPSAAS